MVEMLKGIAASDGVAVAKAYLLVQPDLSFSKYLNSVVSVVICVYGFSTLKFLFILLSATFPTCPL